MHSGTLNTPRRRTLSRGRSEDDSLRHMIKEAEGSARRLMRADSRTSSVKKLDKSESQSEEDLIMRLPEMLDLQANYSDTLQELRGLELQREALVFQVDCLQDALERAEEMLAEAQREVGDTSAELERERQTRKKLEDTVEALMRELESLRAESQATPGVTDSRGHAEVTVEQDSSPSGLGSTQGTMESPVKRSSETTPDGALPSSGPSSANEEGSSHTPPFRDGLKQSSVDSEDLQTGVTEDGRENKLTADSAVTSESPLARFHRIVQKAFAQLPTLALDSSPPQGGIIGRSHSSPGAMPHEEVLAENSSDWCDSVILQESFPGDAPCEAQEDILNTTPPLVPAESNDSSLSNPPEMQRDNADSQAGPPPSPPKELQGQQPGLDPKGLKNPEQCTLS
ncbi:uncharacterized protein si:ch1073-456m8.1 [Brienomyrus brachyistius]|uniref:uncharacterized protein si:ch1073-456m8.1 n=1 Tax=Brienomyrus brachyistius TaxID=42636 RepID=UPI0020B413A2|nr:uncharacterized protein si:ch1073-456m8.1 [Brienomyrus brachyistius]